MGCSQSTPDSRRPAGTACIPNDNLAIFVKLNEAQIDILRNRLWSVIEVMSRLLGSKDLWLLVGNPRGRHLCLPKQIREDDHPTIYASIAAEVKDSHKSDTGSGTAVLRKVHHRAYVFMLNRGVQLGVLCSYEREDGKDTLLHVMGQIVMSDILNCLATQSDVSGAYAVVEVVDGVWTIVACTRPWEDIVQRGVPVLFMEIFKAIDAANWTFERSIASGVWHDTFDCLFKSKHVIVLRLSSMRAVPGGRASISTPTNPCLFDEIEMGSLLGRGGFGTVYRGLWQDRIVAIKVVDGGSVAREVELGLKLKHPNVVETYAYDVRQADSDQQTVIVMELCENGSLRQAVESGLFKTDNRPNLPMIYRVLRDVAQGMAHLHSFDVVHGDLSMNNVLLDADFSAKICDFGMSRNYGGRTMQTKTHGVITHMAPEILLSGSLSLASDVYSFGIIMCEVLWGKRLWSNMPQGQIVTQKTMQTDGGIAIPPVNVYLKNLIVVCTQKNYHSRPTFARLLADLQQKADNPVECCASNEVRTDSVRSRSDMVRFHEPQSGPIRRDVTAMRTSSAPDTVARAHSAPRQDFDSPAKELLPDGPGKRRTSRLPPRSSIDVVQRPRASYEKRH